MPQLPTMTKMLMKRMIQIKYEIFESHMHIIFFFDFFLIKNKDVQSYISKDMKTQIIQFYIICIFYILRTHFNKTLVIY